MSSLRLGAFTLPQVRVTFHMQKGSVSLLSPEDSQLDRRISGAGQRDESCKIANMYVKLVVDFVARQTLARRSASQ
jgi:hypothetical protein